MRTKIIWTVSIAAVTLIAAASPAAAKATKKANEHLTITIDASAPPGSPSPVTATGPISGSGTDQQTSSRTAGRTSHDTDLLTFSGGTVTVKDKSVDHSTLDTSSCVEHVNQKGTFKITSGTGTYAHAKGHGHFTATGDVQGTSDGHGRCDFSHPTGTITVQATGRVSV